MGTLFKKCTGIILELMVRLFLEEFSIVQLFLISKYIFKERLNQFIETSVSTWLLYFKL